jgi:hypothetical protein
MRSPRWGGEDEVRLGLLFVAVVLLCCLGLAIVDIWS